ncbi:reverse transcriptase domain-containing protein [Citrobacter portucalensis]|uniref:reverse transcriptase domain-containing protein n=1 Tax=Citrobacter portucalensis TaxID=1639133 RepID=UPI002B255627|nr:reverse transcriptase domain-containing protein [Citrobacter portucalensis]MEB1054702.1 reverse transcriptase domain-containing protein [Citrobacter portucalensis]
MHKFKLSSHLLDLFSQYKFFSPIHGVQQLSSALVFESRLGRKIIYIPHSDYFSTFRKICDSLYDDYLSQIPINMSAIAYVEGKSYFNFIEPHRNNFFFIRIDIRHFFPSITDELIRNSFRDYFSESAISDIVKQSHLDAIVNFLTLNILDSSINSDFKESSILPMGFPLSPVVSNIIFRRIDIIIERLCAQLDITYTRYADDLLFSSRGKIGGSQTPFSKDSSSYSSFIHTDRFCESIKKILAIDGFKINKNKIIKSKHTLSLNGYTIIGSNNSDIRGEIRVSNKKTKIIEKLLHELNNKKSDKAIFFKCFISELPIPKYPSKKEKFFNDFFKSQIDNKLSGYRSYLISMIKFDEKYDCFDSFAIQKYQKLIFKIDLALSKR